MRSLNILLLSIVSLLFSINGSLFIAVTNEIK